MFTFLRSPPRWLLPFFLKTSDRLIEFFFDFNILIFFANRALTFFPGSNSCAAFRWSSVFECAFFRFSGVPSLGSRTGGASWVGGQIKYGSRRSK